MSESGRYISANDAASFSGLKVRAIYASVEKQKIPVVDNLVCGAKKVMIPLDGFLAWLAVYISRHEAQDRQRARKLEHMKASYRKLKEFLNHA